MSEYMFDINVDVCYDLDQYDSAMIADLKAMKPGDQFEPLYEKYGHYNVYGAMLAIAEEEEAYALDEGTIDGWLWDDFHEHGAPILQEAFLNRHNPDWTD